MATKKAFSQDRFFLSKETYLKTGIAARETTLWSAASSRTSRQTVARHAPGLNARHEQHRLALHTDDAGLSLSFSIKNSNAVDRLVTVVIRR